jgi:CRISPR-associated protein (TIGR02584 family)
MKTKNFLICVSGLTPQIVTETFYCLAVQKKIMISEIYIITTQRGRDVILGIDKSPHTPKTLLKDELHNLCKLYKIAKPVFENNSKHIITAKEESIELSDIRTDKQNILFPNKVADFLRDKTSDPNTTIYCSISGGRKTMSVHLAASLSLFGRENDKMLHVLTGEEYEFKGFYPVNKKEDKALELAELPFIRLRSVLGDKVNSKSSYSDFVEETQKQLKALTDRNQLILKTDTKEVKFGLNTLQLEPIEFAVYFKFLEKKLDGKETLSIGYLADVEFAQDVYEFIREKYPYHYFDDKKRSPWWKVGFGKEAIRSKRSKINKKLITLFDNDIIANNYCLQSIRDYGNTSFYIKADNTKFKLSY